MPLAKDVAAELRKLADSLDKTPEQSVPHVFIHMSHHDKESFLSAARNMPRPFIKEVTPSSYPELRLKYKTDAIHFWNCVPQSLTCELVEPAKPAVYRCDPILSLEEDAELEQANA